MHLVDILMLRVCLATLGWMPKCFVVCCYGNTHSQDGRHWDRQSKNNSFRPINDTDIKQVAE